MSKVKFLDLGKQPIANNFLTKEQLTEEEYFFNLGAVYDEETNLVSLSEFVDKERLFHDNYAYCSSMSKTMREHFELIASSFKRLPRILEIGSNDGVFLKHFSTEQAVSVEPCGNFAKKTTEMGYKTYNNFWDDKLAEKILKEQDRFDIIYAANCMCHIKDLDNAFKSAKMLLKDNGFFVFEDPSLLETLKNNVWEQWYDEHNHIFSITALSNILEPMGMYITHIDNLKVHGGTNRIWVSKHKPFIRSIYRVQLGKEKEYGLDKIETYNNFSKQVEKTKTKLVNLLKELKKDGKKIIAYGATSKSTVVYNYCGITTDLIDYVIDTTPNKQGKLMPGVHIPIISPEEGMTKDVDYAFLGAWNYQEEIRKKEKDFIERGGKFITIVPNVKIL